MFTPPVHLLTDQDHSHPQPSQHTSCLRRRVSSQRHDHPDHSPNSFSLQRFTDPHGRHKFSPFMLPSTPTNSCTNMRFARVVTSGWINTHWKHKLLVLAEVESGMIRPMRDSETPFGLTYLRVPGLFTLRLHRRSIVHSPVRGQSTKFHDVSSRMETIQSRWWGWRRSSCARPCDYVGCPKWLKVVVE